MTANGAKLTVSVEEAAELLGISRTLAYVLAARGELPVLRFGRRIVIPRRRLEELLGGVSVVEQTSLPSNVPHSDGRESSHESRREARLK